MTVTNLANGQQVNLASVLNTKLEKPVLQSEMGLDAQASAAGMAVRWNEFSNKHNNDGSFKGIVDGDISNSAGVKASKLAIRQLYKKSSLANPSATSSTYGTAVTLAPVTGYSSLVPIAIDCVFGGTFGSETVTAEVTVTYSDSTTASVTKTATATGTTSFTNSDIMSLMKDGVYITQIAVQSQSTIASTTATVTFNHAGFYL